MGRRVGGLGAGCGIETGAQYCIGCPKKFDLKNKEGTDVLEHRTHTLLAQGRPNQIEEAV